MRIVAVTTAFFPDENIINSNWEKISGLVHKYIVVDNSCSYTYSCLDKDPESFEVIYSSNGGVSAGLNIGIRRAIEIGADYVVLFDQDSLADEGLVESLMASSERFGKGAIIAPNVLDINSGIPIHKSFFERGRYAGENHVEVNRTQIAGMLIPVSVFNKVGMFDERYFLNFVDTEWCLRAVNFGFKIYINLKSSLFHDFGAGERRVFFLSFRFGKPFRDYYSARDSLFLMCENHLSKRLKLRLLLSYFWGFSQILFLTEKKRRLGYYLQGSVDFFRGIRGPGRGLA